MEVIIYQVDAFTDKPFNGNPAGVVPDARGLSDEHMQKIAREMNVSETAFVFSDEENKFKVRFFTPKCEVDLCGHATIAAFYTLAHKGYINKLDHGIARVYQKTRIGELAVDIYYSNGEVEKVMMYQGKPESIKLIDDYELICKCFNIKESNIGLNGFELMPEIVSTGLSHIILPLKNRELLDNLKVNYDLLSSYSKNIEICGVHAFTIDYDEQQMNVLCRNFAPLVGVNEESATGTANGALTYYLKKNNFLKGVNLLANQGQSLERPSLIHCEIEYTGNDVNIKVGGKATIVLEGVMSI